jgi:CBS-domain-containing membrane protein
VRVEAVEHLSDQFKWALFNRLENITENISKSSLSVLLVDAEISALELIASMLNGKGFDVLTV